MCHRLLPHGDGVSISLSRLVFCFVLFRGRIGLKLGLGAGSEYLEKDQAHCSKYLLFSLSFPFLFFSSLLFPIKLCKRNMTDLFLLFVSRVKDQMP
jgi:hypothetical protein